MMPRPIRLALVLCAMAAPLHSAAAQTFRTDDPVIRRMWQLGMDSSNTERLAQVLNDSIGARLSGTTGFQSAVDWLLATYRGWGVTARAELIKIDGRYLTSSSMAETMPSVMGIVDGLIVMARERRAAAK